MTSRGPEDSAERDAHANEMQDEQVLLSIAEAKAPIPKGLRDSIGERLPRLLWPRPLSAGLSAYRYVVIILDS